jgi:hypothetical protein
MPFLKGIEDEDSGLIFESDDRPLDLLLGNGFEQGFEEAMRSSVHDA